MRKIEKINLTILIFSLILVVIIGGIWAKNGAASRDFSETARFTRENAEPSSEFSSTPYTIMIYMNGSDLESEFGAATDDLVEMLDSGLNAQNANVLILTGGASMWQNSAIPETECVIWQLKSGYIYELETMGKVNMGDPATLRDFIKFCLNSFPAQKYGLIMWDHGGGSIAGFGHDEKFNDASLTLLDMDKAFREAGLAETRLEFLGFDACLMATVEMAVIAANYTNVLIAAEDLEPGEGWDYTFLGALNDDPFMCGFTLGEIIVDSFFEFFEKMGLADEEILTLSVTDLSKAADVMNAMGLLMRRAEAAGKPPEGSALDCAMFREVAVRRAKTKTFGEGSPRDNYADMVDIGDMAIQLADLFPREAEAVLRALKNCVTYNRHNSDVEIYGLSTFYIYGGKSQGGPSLRMYSALGMDIHYTRFLHNFFEGLLKRTASEPLRTEKVLWQPLSENLYKMAGLQASGQFSLLWPRLNGHFVALFPCAATAFSRQYAIPANVNGKEADIIVIISPRHPQGKIAGARYTEGGVFQKGYDPISPGDKIALYYTEYDFAGNHEGWQKSDAFTVTGQLSLEWLPAPVSFKLGERRTNACGEISYTL